MLLKRGGGLLVSVHCPETLSNMNLFSDSKFLSNSISAFILRLSNAGDATMIQTHTYYFATSRHIILDIPESGKNEYS